ncbi:hypothetical protein EVAR_62844_1 [Eumeta japonica]|uniref:Uncharacterized protein n=1 Tax=Eumeta variegata TaxID=151549 RepID=A0A4C1ZCA3_EUMVA|nr:hypothetical protein EVAR_62844_1 [Eumeta japonica]
MSIKQFGFFIVQERMLASRAGGPSESRRPPPHEGSSQRSHQCVVDLLGGNRISNGKNRNNGRREGRWRRWATETLWTLDSLKRNSCYITFVLNFDLDHALDPNPYPTLDFDLDHALDPNPYPTLDFDAGPVPNFGRSRLLIYLPGWLSIMIPIPLTFAISRQQMLVSKLNMYV